MKEIWKKMNLKGHLLTAISYLIPIVCGAGFLVAIGMALGGSSQSELIQGEFSFWDALATMGGTALGLLPVIIATGVSFSIAGKPGIAPGFVVGLSANAISAGFIGGMVGGYIAGFLALWILKNVKVSDWAKGLMPTVIVPLLTSLISGLLMIYIIGIPIAAFTNWLTNFLQGLGSSSMLILGLVIGTLSIVDFGGPINKTVYAFTLTLLASGVNEPVTALQLVNTSTPIGFGLAYFIAKLLGKNIYGQEQIENLKSAVPMGVLNIVEGVIPIVMNDLVRGIIAAAIGGGAGGATSMVLGADSTVPFGGFLMLPTMTRPWTGLFAIIVNVVVTGVVYALIAKNKTAEDFASENDIDEEEINLADIEIL
ncbi:PTS system, fructose-specific IIC component [Streptococcus gallolyticus]|uniref:PTS system, fructose-specific IIC component n=1 Tax=Streptococcus gallolyticus TaxID=315405 RepID=A0A1H7WP45_9STRE|nr:PTS fructose transporter subunit IIC [Streptococcus gallolyticus]SEF23761.1 PTS system, fructose-specific IIC component [Streptococcus gallolyticus]SEM22707.1 PTS system, fructose-specific IIC component [Streptococcus gallolyticus]